MDLLQRLHAAFADAADAAVVDDLTIGLGYTAVTIDGAVGLSYTWFESKTCCSWDAGSGVLEGASARPLLDALLTPDGIARSIGMAAANALNHDRASDLSDDPAPGAVIRDLGAERGSRVAMVGYFPPLARALEERGAELEVIDRSREMGDPVRFGDRLAGWAEIVIMSATTLLNGTAGELLAQTRREARVIVLGPTTPLVPEVFAGTPVCLLGGMVPTDAAEVVRLVRHGAGTPEIQRFARKVVCGVP
jgi:hypothetical protein